MIPRATYRVQLQREFGFDAAAGIADYLAALGVSHVYCSPYLQAAPGSDHGYDVVDPTRVNQDLGGEAAHARFVEALGRAGLGQVLDIVPNHMAIAPQNSWWWDVLENGHASLYASFFDVDWDPPEQKLRNTVLLPVLADHYGRVLEAGGLRLDFDGEALTIRYEDQAFPVAPRSLNLVLGPAAQRCASDELAFIAASYARLPGPHVSDRESLLRRHRDKLVLQRRVRELLREDTFVARAVQQEVDAVNASPDRLDELLEHQNYRLARWRTAGWEVSYRRFFDITSLAALRVEDPHVFDETHAQVLRWVHDGVLDGLRIDHADGLRDPEGYFRRLRQAAGEVWTVAEKIVSAGERLPIQWAVDGTTGYDFLNLAGGLFVDPEGAEPLQQTWADVTGAAPDFAELAYRKRHQVIEELLAGDFNRLTEELVRICEAHRRYRDYTRPELNRALREVAACLPVYRTYVSPARGFISDQDREALRVAFATARRRAPEIEPDLLDFLHRLLHLEERGQLEDELVERFQQTTGPVTAKGVEDSALYCHLRLLALNEVGGDPGRFGVTPAEFHAECGRRQEAWPHTMLAGTTHDTKRSEDVRARLYLLSEIAEEWAGAVRRWREINEPHRHGIDATAEYLLYQTLVGAHPLGVERAQEYMTKALREAKERTSWTRPDEAYEEAVGRFIEVILQSPSFCAELELFAAALVEPGRVNSLALKLLTLTAPGVPDLYQGTELWALSLVDPDNRRQVDYARRRRLLDELADLDLRQVMERADEGLPKLLVVKRALDLRRRLPEAFLGSYEPLEPTGAQADRVLAYCRGGAAISVVPRLVMGLREGWAGTQLTLPPGDWTDAFSGRRWSGAVPVASLLDAFPVALLTR